ncbi:MAG: hypothetical protein WD002_05960, partial [Pseudomonadales bacterium]
FSAKRKEPSALNVKSLQRKNEEPSAQKTSLKRTRCEKALNIEGFSHQVRLISSWLPFYG